MSLSRTIAGVAVALVGSQLAVATASAAARPYVILYKANAVPAGAAAAISKAGGRLTGTIPQAGIAIAVADDAKFATAIAKNSSVLSAAAATAWHLPDGKATVHTEDGPTAADVYYNAGWVWGVERVQAPAAWNAGYTGSHDAVVAVIDTGVAWNHPDLAGNVVHVACYTSVGSDQDGACNPYPAFSWHGTHVAGTIAAQFGSGKVVGVAPNAGIAGYNVFEPIDGCGVCAYDFPRWQAMVDAAARGYKVINMSLGGYASLGLGKGTNEMATYIAADKRITSLVNRMGTVVVASAGNESVNLNGPIYHAPGDAPGTINVAATGIRPNWYYEPGVSYDVRAFYSNYGAAVDISAPGGDCGEDNDCTGIPNWFRYLVFSTYVELGDAEETGIPAACAATASCPFSYAWAAGTSMASPHVSGVAALVEAARPGITPAQVKSTLKATADQVGNRQLFGAGIVNAAAAVGAP